VGVRVAVFPVFQEGGAVRGAQGAGKVGEGGDCVL